MARVMTSSGPFWKRYDDGTILLEKVVLSYPHLAKPYKGDGEGEAKYGVVALLPKATHVAAKNALREMINELMVLNKIKTVADDKKFLRDGDKSDKEDYAGHFTVSARETRRPPLRDRSGQRVDAEDAAEMFYGGCIGAVLIRPWYQNNKYGKRFNAGLSACQLIDGTTPAFGEGRLSEDDVDETFTSYDDDGDAGFDDEDDI